MDRVLVIDDDRASGILVKDILEESDTTSFSGELAELFGYPDKSNGHGGRFHVTLATTGWDGIQTLKKSVLSGDKITLAFVDLILTDMSGLDVGYRLKKIDNRIKVVFLSGMDFSEISPGMERGPTGGPGFFLQKPFTSEDILHCALTLCNEQIEKKHDGTKFIFESKNIQIRLKGAFRKTV